MNNKGFIVDKRAKKFSGKKEQISITAEGRGVYITQLTHNLPQQLKFLRAEINLIKSEIEKGEYQTKYKKDLAEAKKQIETRKAEFEKTCEEKGITPEQAGRNLVNYAQDHFKTAEEQIAFLEELGGTNLVKDLEQPLKDATKEMFELYLFFNEQVGWPEGISEHSWVVFEPGMKLFYAAHTLSPVDFEFMLMKMRTEEKARMAYINKMNNYLSYDYDKEVKDYMKEHGEEVNKYLEKAFSKSSGSEWFNKSLARVYVIMPRDREHYNAYMTEYRKSQRERIDQVLDQVSELITIMKENQIIKTEVSRAKRGY